MDFEHKIAYEIGVKLAHEHYYMEKEAWVGAAAKQGWTGLKWLAGMGGGNAASRTLGGATGFGLMGAASSEAGWENKLKGFVGGAASGMAFSAAMPAAGKLFKGLNKSWASSATKLKGPQAFQARMDANVLDTQKNLLKSYKKTISGKGPNVDATKKKLEAIEESYKANSSAYKKFLKSQDVGIMGRTMGAMGRHRGTVLGGVGGMGGGMYLSGIIQDEFDKTQRPLLPRQSNIFNPIG
jgi:hypothetical protein